MSANACSSWALVAGGAKAADAEFRAAIVRPPRLPPMRRIFYVSAGGADIIKSHEYWRRGEHNPNEVSLTFSGQIESFVREIGAKGYLVSGRDEARRVNDGEFTVEHRLVPRGQGVGFYWAALRYAVGLVRTARRFGADVALLDSGTMPIFMMGLFRLAGIEVVPILHNSLWPSGFRQTGYRRGLVQKLDAMVFRSLARCAIAVSPEVRRQIGELAGARHCPVLEMRAQFDRDYFRSIPQPDADATPFHVLFVGRVVPQKGVLDIPTMARHIEDRAPGSVRWTICGRGSALEALRCEIAGLDVGHIVDARGWTSPEELRHVIASAHALIVPTRGDFAEGLAMSAAESILAGRPIVTNPVVPALELLSPAAIAARAGDPASHAEAILSMAQDRSLYRRLQLACGPLQAQFYDRAQGLAAVLQRALC